MTQAYIYDYIRNTELRKGLRFFVATAVIAVAFAVLLLARNDDAFDNYMSNLIPFLLAFVLFYLYASIIKANLTMVFAFGYIAICSLSLMSIIATGSISKHIFGMYSAMAIYAVIKFFVVKIKKKKLLLWFLAIANVLIYTVLTLQPRSEELDNTKAWLIIGGFTFQLTELIKIILVCFLAVLYTSDLKDRPRFIWLIVYLGINIAGSVCIGEFGSLLALLIVLAIGVFIFENSKKNLLLFFGGITICAVAGVAFILLLNGKTGSADESLIQYFIDRLMARFLGSDRYQIEQALKAISNGSAFGSFDMVEIPAHSNDFAFASLIQCMGAFIGVTFLLAFIVIAYLTYLYVPDEGEIEGFDKKASIASVLFIIFQSVLIIIINLDLFPITGINCLFLSSGGASQIISYVMLLFAISGTAKVVFKRKENYGNEAVRKI